MKFGTAKKKAKPPRSVRELLHRGIARYQKPRPLDVIHASDLTSEREEWCPRAVALMELEGVKAEPELITTAQRVAWEISSAVAEQVVRWLSNQNRAIGTWVCARCNEPHYFSREPERCACCEREVFHFEEYRFTSAYSDASCGIDLLVPLPGKKKVEIVEMKALEKVEFKALKAPLAEHRFRTNLYLRLAAESTDPNAKKVNTQCARILYVAKGGWGVRCDVAKEYGINDGPWSPFKEYVVKRDDEQTEEVTQKARSLKLYREGAGELPVGVCPTPLCMRAKSCKVVARCFSEDPA